MAFSSTDIAALTGGFNQQVMLQQQQASMITQQFGGYSPNPYAHPVASQGEQFSGMLMQGMGQMGMSALGSQRLNTMGGGIAAPFTQTGQMMMGQMMYGAQQQQMLDANLRQSYRHPNSFGGRGFSGTDTAMIGSNLRQLSHQRGPGGETASFEELGQLASNMGRMGMAEGVRSVKDFNEKFKTMLSTVKTIATELGTSLEEAQKVMASMKGSGIFKNQGQFAGMIRQGALAGNISSAEMSSSAMMGAQISRSIGGLGKSGAMAGIQTMSNIGAATQAGVMSEEDIYNVTGLTGAEGRQAMSQNMMSGDARFFSGGLGRRVLASIAGKDGKVNQNDVMAYMAGGVSTGETMGMAHRNLGKVGRANFIRNEGRLRGEAMASFGGLGKAIVARNWMEERGMNMNEMDDRSMLFFQRKFGVGRDEADQIIKMARNMDTIMSHRQKSAENDQYLKRIDQAERGSKPEEIVKRLEMARNEVNDGLRELGASFQKSMSTSIEEFIGKMSGDYVKRRRGAMAGIVNQMMRGGPGTEGMLEKELGLKVGAGGKLEVMGMSAAGKAAHGELFGTGGLSGAQFNRFLGGNANRFREAGYDITGAKNMGEFSQLQQRASAQALGFATGTGRDLMDEGTMSSFRGMAANGTLGGSGDKLMQNFEQVLSKLQTDQGKALAEEFKKASAEDRGKMMSDVLSQAGVKDAFAGRMDAPGAIGPGGGSKYATLAAENRAIGDMVLGSRSRYGAEGPTSLASRVSEIGGDASLVLGGKDSLAGRNIGGATSWLSRQVSGIDAMAKSYMADTPEAAAKRDQLAKSVTTAPRSGLSWLQGGLDAGLDKASRGLGFGGTAGTKGLVGDVGQGLGVITGGLEEFGQRQIKGALGEYNDVEKQALGEYLKSDEGRDMAGTIMGSDARASKKMTESITTRRIKLSNMKNPSNTEKVQLEGLRALEAMGRIRAAGDNPSAEDLKKIAGELGYPDVGQMLKSAGGVEATANEEQRRDRAQAFEGVGMQATADLAARAESDKAIDADIASGEIKVGAGATAYRDKMKALRKAQAGLTGDASVAGDAANRERYGKVLGMQKDMDAMRGKGTIQERREMAKQLMQTGEGAEGMRMMSEIKAEERLTKGAQRGTAGTLEAVAGSLGVDFQKGDFKGMGSGAGVRELMNRMGLGDGSTVKNRDKIEAELQSIIGDKGLSSAQRGQKLAALQGREEIVQGQREQQNKQSEARDPSFRRLGEVKTAVESVKTAVSNLATTTLTVRELPKE